MKNLTFVLPVLMLFSINAKAETFNCSFTEPFIRLSYSTEAEVLSLTPAFEETIEVKNVSIRKAGKDLYHLKDSKGEVLAEIRHDDKGSDGMSSAVYPFSIRFDGLSGGCTSSEQGLLVDFDGTVLK